jgi:hypothetical protein
MPAANSKGSPFRGPTLPRTSIPPKAGLPHFTSTELVEVIERRSDLEIQHPAWAGLLAHERSPGGLRPVHLRRASWEEFVLPLFVKIIDMLTGSLDKAIMTS